MKQAFDVLVEQDEEGWLVASVPVLQGCHTQAGTAEQLLERVGEAIALCLEVPGAAPLQFVGIRRDEVPA